MNDSLPRPPFNNPAGDTIIRTRDGVNFRVRSGILAEASPIFSDMFTVPLPDPITNSDDPNYLDGKPVVAVQEDSVTLDHLLRLCYPVADPNLTELSQIRSILAAAMKYEMEEAVTLMKKALLAFIDSQPFAVWASACSLGLADEAMTAARVLLRDELPDDGPPELQEVTAGTYFRLLKFHHARGDVEERFSFFEPLPEDVPLSKTSDQPDKCTIVYQDRPFSDLICRSSDRREFSTHKIILGSASPLLLKKILALPSEPSSSLPVLDIDVPSSILGPMLELCYPVRYSSMKYGQFSAVEALPMIAAAKRLSMDALYNTLRYDSMAIGTAKVRQPLATYLLACQYGLSDIAKEARRFLSGADLLAHGCIPEMEITPALHYHRLFVDHQRSLARVSRILQSASSVAGVKVFVGNLAYSTTDEGLKAFFEPVQSEVLSAEVILRGSIDQSSAGYGLVSLKTVEGARKAVELFDKKSLDGRTVIVELAKAADQPQKPGQVSVASEAEANPTSGHPWLIEILERTAERFRSHDKQMTLRWADTLGTLKESVRRKVWCDRCKDNVYIILRIEKMHEDVRDAVCGHCENSSGKEDL